MKDRKGRDWIPLWSEKWILGSTRIELEPDERSVWVDFLAMGAKDDGWIRANEDLPYHDRQLAGMLCIEVELLNRAKEKFVKHGKLEILENGTMRIIKWEKYQLSPRHMRRIEAEIKKRVVEILSKQGIEAATEDVVSRITDAVSGKADIVSENTDKQSGPADTKRDIERKRKNTSSHQDNYSVLVKGTGALVKKKKGASRTPFSPKCGSDGKVTSQSDKRYGRPVLLGDVIKEVMPELKAMSEKTEKEKHGN